MNAADALKYILWRYGQEHAGEDHQERVRVVNEWLEQQAASPVALDAPEQDVPPEVLRILPHWGEIMLSLAENMRPYSTDRSVDLRREVQIITDWLVSLRPHDAPAAGANGGERCQSLTTQPR